MNKTTALYMVSPYVKALIWSCESEVVEERWMSPEGEIFWKCRDGFFREEAGGEIIEEVPRGTRMVEEFYPEAALAPKVVEVCKRFLALILREIEKAEDDAQKGKEGAEQRLATAREALAHCTENPSQAGHDLWLTSQGHGTGFWDRDAPGEPARDLLTTLAERCGATYDGFDLYIH